MARICSRSSTAAVAGAVSIAVTSSVRFAILDKIGIMLANGDLFRTAVTGVSDATHVEFSPALPWAVDVGALVTDFTAVAASDIAP